MKSDRVLLHHPVAGEGEYHAPIRPFWITSTHFDIPSIEQALFGEFGTGKRLHRRVATGIFQQSIERSRSQLLWLIEHPHFDARAVSDLCKSAFGEVETYLSAKDRALVHRFFQKYPQRTGYDASLPLEERPDVNPPAWTGSKVPPADHRRHSYYYTVWLRINCAQALAEGSGRVRHEKVRLFMDAHLPVVRYLDSLPSYGDEYVNPAHLCSLYVPLGKTRFDEDRNLIKTSVEHRVQTRPYPLEALRKKYPKHAWTIEEVIPIVTAADVARIEAHGYSVPGKMDDAIAVACLYLMAQCKELGTSDDDLWFYHGCLVETVFSEWSAYPYDNLCFTGYDLPDAFHVLAGINLWGEQVPLEFTVGKFIQKCLPFAGARRGLVAQTEKTAMSNPAFWNLLSQLFHCMLLDMYPGGSEGRCFDLQRILKIRRLVSNREALCAAINRKNLPAKQNDMGCYIVFTAFRLWLVLMVRNQAHYQEAIAECMDWPAFESQVLHMAQSIRTLLDVDDEDVFKDVRKHLCGGKMRVYRYRPSNLVDTLSSYMMGKLEKKKEGGDVSDAIKNHVLNALTRVPRTDWLTPVGLSILRLEPYGRVSDSAVLVALKLIKAYYKHSAKPKKLESHLKKMGDYDFKVVCWYFHVLSILGRIDFEPLAWGIVDKIDEAMVLSRYVLFPGQECPKSAFNVFFTLCCGKIKTLSGPGCYGHEDIAYDIERNAFVCAKSQKKVTNYKSDDFAFMEFENSARKQRKEFNFMQCRDNPVLSINIRGFMLIYNRQQRYMHCPVCGAFHLYKWQNHHADGYSCCRKPRYYYTCHVCGKPLGDSPIDVRLDAFQHVYVCKKHEK